MLKRLAIVVLICGACAGVKASSVDIAEIQKMEALWRSRGVTTYSFTPGLHSSAPRLSPAVRVYVAKSRVKDIRLLATFGRHKVGSHLSASTLRKLAPLPLTVDEAFLSLRKCVSDNAPLVSVTFDEETGAPLYWTCGELAEDGWWGVELKDLETGTPPNKRMQAARASGFWYGHSMLTRVDKVPPFSAANAREPDACR